MRVVSEGFRIICNIISNIITGIIGIFIRRDKEIWLMGAWYGERFGGNSRFLFQYLSENLDVYGLKKAIWVTRKKDIYNELREMGYEVYMMYSLKSIYYHLRAGVHVISVNSSTSYATSVRRKGDILGTLSLGAKHIYINHGIMPLKANKIVDYSKLKGAEKAMVGLYMFLSGGRFMRHYILATGGWDDCVFVTPSENIAEIERLRSIKGEEKQFVIAGLPEMCKPVKYTFREREIISIIESKEKVILYLPTYRTNPNTGFRHPLDDKGFCQFLRERNYFWMEKLHPGAKASMKAKYYDPTISMSLESELDVNVLIRFTDVVISDYSTVGQKAIYFDKPLVNYCPDIEGYVKLSNGVYSDFAERLLGETAKDEEELQQKLEIAFSEEFFMRHRCRYQEAFKEIFGNKEEYDSIMQKIVHTIG